MARIYENKVYLIYWPSFVRLYKRHSTQKKNFIQTFQHGNELLILPSTSYRRRFAVTKTCTTAHAYEFAPKKESYSRFDLWRIFLNNLYLWNTAAFAKWRRWRETIQLRSYEGNSLQPLSIMEGVLDYGSLGRSASVERKLSTGFKLLYRPRTRDVPKRGHTISSALVRNDISVL